MEKNALEGIKTENNCSAESFEDLDDLYIKGLILVRVELLSFQWRESAQTLHPSKQGGREDPYLLLQKEGNNWS